MLNMPSVNIRQLRDTKRLKAWLRAGKTVELRERDEVIARIVPQASLPQPGIGPILWPCVKKFLATAFCPEPIW
jgi:hypothetical protein